MEMYLPEIALKQPKTDPRTVLWHKRNFLESSSDHIQEKLPPHKISFQMYTTIDKCDDRLVQEPQQTLESRLESQTSSALSTLKANPTVLNTTSTATSTRAASVPLSSSSSSTLHSTTLVNFKQTCHSHKLSSLHFYNDNLSYLYKFPQTKLLLVLLFICCAISSSYLPTTQAIPVRRTTASGQRLILHSNVYRERYHQNLLQDQKHHRQQQQQLLQKHQQYQQQLKYQQHQQHPQLPHKHQPVQRPSSYLAPILRRVHHQLQHHHLHQRAAPTANQQKMSYCESEGIFGNLYLQINTSLDFIKRLCVGYLRTRENATYDEMEERWKLLKLDIRNPRRKPINFENELHQKMHDFYLNLHNFQQLVEEVHRDTTANQSNIMHDEEISPEVILTFFDKLKKEIGYNMGEAEKVLQGLAIEKPNLEDNKIQFRNIAGKIRDFLVIKELIEEMQMVSTLLKMNTEHCQPGNNGFSNGQMQ